MRKVLPTILFGLCAFSMTNSFADTIVPINLTSPNGTSGKSIGTVTLSDTRYGLLITPNLNDLTPGLHGFHIHDNPTCADTGMAAGGHLDPQQSHQHAGPYNNSGHLGDLPALYVDNTGHAALPVLAPRLTLNQVKSHTLMIHAGGDNYTDSPAMGGGGARIACGVIK